MRKNKLFAGFAFICLLFALKPADAQYSLDSTKIDTHVVIGDMDIPWEVKWGPDNWLWVTERYGRFSRVHPDNGTRNVVLDHSNEVLQLATGGLLGFDFHPEFPDSPYVYTIYTFHFDTPTVSLLQRLVRFEFATDTLINEQVLADSILGMTTHVGSRPTIMDDNTIILSTGSSNNHNFADAQDLGTTAGKFLRYNLDGSIPADNPFPGSPVWSWGNRNPQGLAIHNGIVYESEHGPNTDDEINIIVKRGNYGWPDVRGFCDEPDELTFCADSPVVAPIWAFSPTVATSDIIYYDRNEVPEWKNSIILATLKNSRIYQLKLSDDGTEVVYQREFFTYEFGRLRDIAVSPTGRIFISAQKQGVLPFEHQIIELIPKGPVTCPAPKNLRIAITSGTSVRIDWDPVPGGANNYEFNGKVLPDGDFQSLILPGTATSFEVTALNPVLTYGVTLRAACTPIDFSGYSEMKVVNISFMNTDPCTTPIVSTSAYDITETQTTIGWSPVINASQYEIRGSRAVDFPAGAIHFLTGNEKTELRLNDLLQFTTFAFQVRAICINGSTGQWSQVRYFTTPGCAPPAQVSNSNVGSTQATLQWSKVEEAVAYEIYGKRLTSSGVSKVIIFPADTSRTVFGLAPGNAYVWTVISICRMDASVISNFAPLDTFITTLKTIHEPSAAFDMSIHPNPNSGLFELTLSGNAPHADVRVYDQLGRVILQQEVHSTTTSRTLDLRDRAKGVYFVEVRSDAGSQVRKVVFQ